jgi:hypothetical protein
MRFIIGKTACTSCGLPIDVMDDSVPVTPVLAGGTPWCGYHHRDCFDRLPDRATLVRNWRELTEKQVRTQPRNFPVLASSPRFLLVARPTEEKVGIYFLDWFAELRLGRPGEWDEFRDFLLGDEIRNALDKGGEIVSASERFAVSIGPDPKQARLSWTVPTGREIEYPPALFEAYTAAMGPLAGFVDFAALAAQGELTPSDSFGDLARCGGTVRRVDRTSKGYEVIYTAQQPVSVEIGRAGLEELQGLLEK